MGEIFELNNLPFDVEDDLGEILKAYEECPGVYYIATPNEEFPLIAMEYYVVTDKASMISATARAYGKPVGESPTVLSYNINNPKSGKFIIDYEIARYRIQNNLPQPEDKTIHDIAVFGREMHPDYFGAYPVPQVTPWGYTLRYKAITNGLYWIETDTCQTVLAVCYPMQDDLSSAATSLARLTDYDSEHGLDNTKGYLFFTEKDSCMPVFELMGTRPEWVKNINKAALMNALYTYHPKYTITHNELESQGLNDHLGLMAMSMGTDVELRSSPDKIISFFKQAGTEFFHF